MIYNHAGVLFGLSVVMLGPVSGYYLGGMLSGKNRPFYLSKLWVCSNKPLKRIWSLKKNSNWSSQWEHNDYICCRLGIYQSIDTPNKDYK